MDENNIDSSSHDILHLRSSSEQEFKSLSAENYNNISVAQSSNKHLINDCHGREGTQPTMAMASSNSTAREELELTFEYEGQKYRADSNCRHRDFQIASSISGHFEAILNQHPAQNLRFDLISATDEEHSLVSVSEVPVSEEDVLVSSQSELTVSAVLEDISVLQMKEGSESNFPNAVFNCACCSTLAPYPGVTEFCVNTSVPISNSNAELHGLHSLENPPLVVTVVNALNLIFEYPALFSSKLDGSSTSPTSKSIFTTTSESHLDNSADDKDFPLCSKCGLSIQQLYLTYKEFTSLLESEGRIIKAINEKLAFSNNSIQNYKLYTNEDDPHEGNLSGCHSSPNDSSRNNMNDQPEARDVEETPKEVFNKSVPNQKKKRGKKNNLRIARPGGKCKKERESKNQNQSSQQSESQQVLILSLNDKEQCNLILENTENVKKVDAKVIKSKSQLPFGLIGKRGPGRPKGPNRPKNVKQLAKNRLNPNKSKAKPSPSVSAFKKHISSSAVARKKKSSSTNKQEEDFILAISRDGQKDTTSRSVVEVYAKKSGYLAGEYNADGFVTKSEDLFLEKGCLEGKSEQASVSQRGRRRKPKALFSSEMKVRVEGKKSQAITTTAGALPRTPPRKRKKNTSSLCDLESGNLTVTTMLTSTSPTTAKRIRNWKKESWIEKAQSDPSRTCDLCGKAFIFPAVMRRHKKIVHQGLKPYECSSCGKRFTQKVILNKHTCDFNKESGNRREFLQMTRESELRKFACSVCGHKFKYQTHLNLHEMNHRDERPYPCSQCDKTFRRPDHLKYHVRIVHVEEKKFICIKCGLCFKSISSLRAHEKKHGSEQGHLCNICGKSIKSMYQMSRHQKTHQDELPFVCPVCHKKFKMKDYLGQHLRRGKTCSKKLPEEKEKLLQEQQLCKIENLSNLNSPSHQQPVSTSATSILGASSIHDVNSSDLDLDLATGHRSMNSHPTEIEIVNRDIITSSTSTTTPALNNIIIITTTRTLNNSSSLEHGEHPKNDEFSSLSETPSNSNPDNNYGSDNGPSHHSNEDGSVLIVIDEKLLTQL